MIALTLEFCVRLLGLAEPLAREYAIFTTDPILPFRTKPGLILRGRSASDEFDFEFRHNRKGFRDEDHSLAKPEGVTRILGLGDSFTYGAGADYEETYLKILEARLNQNRPNDDLSYEVIKCGIPRFFPEPERLLLAHEGLTYDPNLILVTFLPNDVMDTYLGVDSVVVDDSGYLRRWEAAEIGTAGLFLYKHSHVLRLLFRKYLDRQFLRSHTVDWRQVFQTDGIYEGAWQKVESEYDRMVEIARAANTPIAFVHIPMKPAAVEYFKINDPGYSAARLKAWATRRGVPFIDTTPALLEASKREPVFWKTDVHCTPAGYRTITNTIYEALLENALIQLADQ